MEKIPVLDGNGHLLGTAATRREAWDVAGKMTVSIDIDFGGEFFRAIRREGPRHWVRQVTELADGQWVWEATRVDGVTMYCLEEREPPTWADAAWYSRRGAEDKGWLPGVVQ